MGSTFDSPKFRDSRTTFNGDVEVPLSPESERLLLAGIDAVRDGRVRQLLLVELDA